MFDFENLDLYKKSLEMIRMVYNQTNNFPIEERFGLTNQYRRAANSVALNIGEGYGESILLSLKYLRISKGSIRECLVCAEIALQQNYINENQYKEMREILTDLSKMSSGYKKYLEKKLK
jgi:four helix bundle protein